MGIRHAGAWSSSSITAAQCRHSTSKPAVIRALEHECIVQVAAGGWHCLAVTEQGKLFAWGGNEYFQCGLDAGVCKMRVDTLQYIVNLSEAYLHCHGMVETMKLRSAGHAD